jgi:type I restriction enzyme R subunit
LEERGFAGEHLREITRIIDAEKSDLYDVLAYIAYARKPVTRAERAETTSRKLCRYMSRNFRDFWISCSPNM